MKSSILGAIYGSLVADALALGVQWEYDTSIIKKTFPEYETFKNPTSKYQETKKAGDFTHYGDQAVWLLESIAMQNEFSLDRFSKRWQEYMKDYQGYMDETTKTILHSLQEGKTTLSVGSKKQEITPIGRLGVLTPLLEISENEFIDACVLQVKMTHTSQQMMQATQFFAKILILIINGNVTPKDAVLQLQKEINNKQIANWIKIALISIEHDSIEAITSFGQSSSLNSASTSILHLILKYEDNYKEAMLQNVYAGGECASRGMVAGMILGAFNTLESIPELWVKSLNNKDRIEKYLDMFHE